jgi:uncharacterized protein (DUF362 family)
MVSIRGEKSEGRIEHVFLAGDYAKKQEDMKRRDLLNGPGCAGAAPAFNPYSQQTAPVAPVPLQPVPPARVGLVKGNDRKQIIYDALKRIEDEVLSGIGEKKILIKPNMAVPKNPLAVTHVDAVRAVLEFLAPHHKRQITIGESGVFSALEGYKNNGYEALEKEFNVGLVDLNATGYQFWYVFGKGQNPQPVRFISTFLDPEVYIISLARMKTHDCVLVTLSLKNVLMASPLNDYKRSDKGYLHGPAPAVNDILHFNLFHVGHRIYPDLAVIDGYEAMEGDGPAWGTPFEARVALAGTDALATDTVATRIMGFDPEKVLYLSALRKAGLGQGDMAKISLLGTPLDQCLYRFKMNKRLADFYQT